MTRLATLTAIAILVAFATSTPFPAFTVVMPLALVANGGAVAGVIVIISLVGIGALSRRNPKIPLFASGTFVALAAAAIIITELWVSSCPSCVEGESTRAEAYRGAPLLFALAATAAAALIGLGALLSAALRHLHAP